METSKTCTKCHATKPTSDFYMNGPRRQAACKRCTIKSRGEYKRANRGKVLVWAKKYRVRYAVSLRAKANEKNRQLKLEFIAAYGGCCTCCGEREVAFLTLEHVNRDGKAHREKVGYATQMQLLDMKRRGWPKDAYTVFCMNCNMATKDGRPCPHKSKPKFIVVG